MSIRPPGSKMLTWAFPAASTSSARPGRTGRRRAPSPTSGSATPRANPTWSSWPTGPSTTAGGCAAAPTDPASTILVDTTRYLTAVQVGQSGATAQAGASMDDLLEALGAAGLGLA